MVSTPPTPGTGARIDERHPPRLSDKVYQLMCMRDEQMNEWTNEGRNERKVFRSHAEIQWYDGTMDFLIF